MIMQIHRGPYLQRGRGVGSVLAAVFRNTVVPTMKLLGKRAMSSDLVRSVGSTLAKSAIQGGLNFATDALNGGNLKESAVTNLAAAKRELATTVKRALKTKRAINTAASSVKRARLPHRRLPMQQRSRASTVKNVFAEHTDEDESDLDR
jgi:hypothetical protein